MEQEAEQIQQQEQTAPPNNPTPKKRRLAAFLNDFMDIAESVFTSVFVVLLVFAFVFRPVTVEGSSMLPTLQNNDRLLMFEWFYAPKQGDIVIVDGTKAHLLADDGSVIEQTGIGITLVKRVIAVGGQELNIDFTQGTVSVDGELLEEDYLKTLTTLNDGAFTYPLEIPEGYVFVMGDNRNGSSDSRNKLVGLVKESDIIGHVLCRFYRDEDKRDSWADQFSVL